MSPSIEIIKPQETSQLPDNAALNQQLQQQVQYQQPIYHHHHHQIHPSGHMYSPYMYTTQPLVPITAPHYHHYQPTIQHNQLTSLYVGDLSYDVNEIVLNELFSKVGRNAIASIHVCRDSTTLRSLGYAYVNFYNNHDAERALDTLNHSMIHGKPCRIMWSYRDPTKRKSNIGNVFVKNLEKGVDNAMLYDIFSSFGNILSCKVEYEKGISKGYGYVHFERQESSEKAIHKVNGTVLLGKTISVEPFVPKDERFKEHKEKNENKLFFRNMDEGVTAEEIQTELAKFGEIESCSLRTDTSGKSKGLGVIEFKNHEDAQNLLASSQDGSILVNQKPIQFDRIKNKIERYTEYRKKSSESSLFINNIDESVDKELIQAEFNRCGKVLGIKIVQDDQGKNKGYGFITYADTNDANNAVTLMNGFTFGQKQISVSFSNKDQKSPSPISTSPTTVKQPKSINGAAIVSSNGATAAAANGHTKPTSNNLSQYYINRNSTYQAQPVYVPNTTYYPVSVPVRYQKTTQPYKSSKSNATTTTPAVATTNITLSPQSNGNKLNSNSNGFRNNNGTAPTTNGNNNKRTNSPTMNGKSPKSSTPAINTTESNATNSTTSSTSTTPTTPNTPPTSSTTLTLEHLLSLCAEDAKEAIGSEIYLMVMNKHPNNAAKITGMILESVPNTEEMFNLISSGQIHQNIDQAQSILVESTSN